MSKQLFDLTDKIKPNAQFFRLLALIVLASVIISRFPWVNGLLARIISIPDVRHNIMYQPVEGEIALITAEVINLGQVKADNVLIHFQSRNGEIIDYFIDSQDTFVTQEKDLENGFLEISLLRLAPGARTYIELTGKFVQDQTFFSVTSDQGTSIGMDLPSFSSQVQAYATSMTSLYDKTLLLVSNNLPFDEQIAVMWASDRIVGFSDLIFLSKTEDFKTAISATIVLSLIIALFFPHLAWLIPFIAALAVLLLANFQISLGFVVATTLLLLTPLLLGTLFADDDDPARWYIGGFWAFAILAVFVFWEKPISARWLTIPTIILVVYLLLLISKVIPAENVEQKTDNKEHKLVIQTEQSPQSNGTTSDLNHAIEQINNRLALLENRVETGLSDQKESLSRMEKEHKLSIQAMRSPQSNVSTSDLNRAIDQFTNKLVQLENRVEKGLHEQKESIYRMEERYRAILKFIRRIDASTSGE